MPLGPRPFEIARENVEHDAISVTDDEIKDAMRLTAEQLKQARYLSREYLGHISGTSRAYLGHISGIPRAYLGHTSGTSRAYLGHISWQVVEPAGAVGLAGLLSEQFKQLRANAASAGASE